MSEHSLSVAGKAAAVLMLIALVSRILGFLRESFLAAYFGSDWQTDAFFVANVIPVVLFQAAATGIFTNFIPMFVRLENLEGKEASQDFLDRVGTILVLALAAIGLLMWIGAPQLTSWIAPGFDSEAHALAVTLTRLLVPTMIFQGLTSFFGAVLNARHRFSGAALIFLLYNLGTILSIVAAGPRWGLVGVTVSLNLVTLVQALLTGWLILRGGYRLRWRPAKPDSHVRQLAVLATPTLIASVTAQVNVVIDRVLASGLPPGSVSALSFADRINALPVYMFAIPIATVALPAISELASHWNDKTRQTIFERVSVDLRRATFWVLPVSIAFVVLSRPVTALLLERGAFTSADTEITAITLAYFSIGSVFWGWREILLKAFFAMGKTKLPMRASLATMAVNALLSLALGPRMGAHGLSLAFSLSMILNSLWLLFGLCRELGVRAALVVSWLPRLLAAGAILTLLLGVVVLAVPDREILVLVVAGMFAGGVFVMFAGFLGIAEARQLAEPVARGLKRIRELFNPHLTTLHRAAGMLLSLSLALATIGFTPDTQTPIGWLQLPRLGLFALTALLVVIIAYLRPKVPSRELLLPVVVVFTWSCVSLLGHGTPLREALATDWRTFVMNIVWFGVVGLWAAQANRPLESLARVLAPAGYLLLVEGLFCLIFVTSYGEFGVRNPGLVGNPNGHAFLLLVTAPAVWHTLPALKTLLTGLVFALQAWLIFSTGSRGGILVFVFVLCVRLFLNFRFERDVRAMAQAALGALIGVLLWSSALPTHDAPFTRHLEENVPRVTLTTAGLRVMAAEPLIGAGIKELGHRLEAEVRRIHPDRDFKPFQASSTSHGVIPTLGAAFGAPSAAAALWLFGVLAVWLVRLAFGRSISPGRAYLAASIAVLLPYLLFEDKFFFGSGVLGSFFWAILAGLNQARARESGAP